MYGNTLSDDASIALGYILGVGLFGFIFYKGIKYLWYQSKKQSIKISKEENKAKYCKWSIAALIFAILGGWLGIVFGIIALFRIKKNPNLRGKTEAIVAIIIAFPMMFIWVYISVLDPTAFLPEEPQMKTYCEEICLEEQNLQNTYVEINPDNQSQYLCSCLDSDNYIVTQYEALVGFSKI